MASAIAFWSVLEHHALAIRPIYNKMKAQGKNVVDLFNHPARELLPYECIVSGTAPNIPRSKRRSTIYHFHSVHPVHANPIERDHKYLPLLKGVMFPGEWWVSHWKRLPPYWRVIGWPKSDLLQSGPPQKPKGFSGTVLYATGMHNFDRLKTLHLLIKLSKELGFRLLVKPHGGRTKWYPELLKTVYEITETSSIQCFDALDDISNLFQYADILVGESSGSLWEFLATGRPSIHVDINARAWHRVFPGGVVKGTLETLPEILEFCLTHPHHYDFSEWREKVIGKVDGKATDRAIAFIEEVFSE